MKLIAFVGHAEAQAPHAMHFSLSMSKALSCSAIAPGHASAQREHEAFLFRYFHAVRGVDMERLAFKPLHDPDHVP